VEVANTLEPKGEEIGEVSTVYTLVVNKSPGLEQGSNPVYFLLWNVETPVCLLSRTKRGKSLVRDTYGHVGLGGWKK